MKHPSSHHISFAKLFLPNSNHHPSFALSKTGGLKFHYGNFHTYLCVQVLPKLNSNFLCLKKARFLDDKSNTCCLLFFNSASFDIFLAKVWIFFFASLLWNCFWKFAFFFLLKVCFGANAIFVSSSYLKVVREEEKSMLKGYLRRRRAAASEERESWLNFLPSKHSFT